MEIFCCKTKYLPSIYSQVQRILRRFLPKTGIRIFSSLLNTTHTLYNSSRKVTYVLNANTGSYRCSKIGVIGHVSPLNCVLKSRNDNATLKGHLVTSCLGNVLGRGLYGTFARRCTLARTSIVQGICQRPSTGHFLTSFAPFLVGREARPSIRHVLARYFSSFFREGMGHCSMPGSMPMRFIKNVTTSFPRRLGRATRGFKGAAKLVVRRPVRGVVGCRVRAVRGSNFALTGPWGDTFSRRVYCVTWAFAYIRLG